jgi:WD40 repeat protein
MINKKDFFLIRHGDRVNQIAFSNNGRYMATASEDKTVQVYDLHRGRLVAKLSHEAEVNSVVFSPDDRYLATASSDKTARVWLIPEGREISRVTHEADVFRVSISRDGKYLSTASMDGTARRWLLDHEEMRKRVCARLTRNLTVKEWRQYVGSEPYRPTCPGLPDPTKMTGKAKRSTGR